MRAYNVTWAELCSSLDDEWERVEATSLRDAAYRFIGKYMTTGDIQDGMHSISVVDSCDSGSYLSIVIEVGDR